MRSETSGKARRIIGLHCLSLFFLCFPKPIFFKLLCVSKLSYGRPLRLPLTGRTKGKDLGDGATEDERERHAKRKCSYAKAYPYLYMDSSRDDCYCNLHYLSFDQEEPFEYNSIVRNVMFEVVRDAIACIWVESMCTSNCCHVCSPKC